MGHSELRATWLGTVPYQEAWDLQRALVAAVAEGRHPGALLLLEHPHVFTLGRRGLESNVVWDAAERGRRRVALVRADRGGDVTYHGPGQLVAYPILDLSRTGSDVLRHVHAIEAGLVEYLSSLGLEAFPGGESLTGVWSRGPAGRPRLAVPAKVAAIGVKVTAGISSHGLALNLTTDLGYFEGIVGCGLQDRRATSVAALGGPVVEPVEAAPAVAAALARAFGLALALADAAELGGLPPAPPPEVARPPFTEGVSHSVKAP